MTHGGTELAARPDPQFPPSPANGELKDAVADIGAYPVLTEEVSFPGTPAPDSVGSAGAAPIGRIVHGALRDVLGWRPNANDPKGFVAALTHSFDCTETRGRTECVWVPRTYSVQADLGAVTGAQASIYARAKAALEQSLPLIDGLKPLKPDFDEEEGEAQREIVRFKWSELVQELGRVGGPRVQRVDSFFELLLGQVGTDELTRGDNVTGQLGQLRKVFGLKADRVNTISEEEILTNYLITVDLVSSLKASWDTQRDFFSRNDGDVFFGTQTVLLSRALVVVAESVEEVRFAMNSVFVGPAERQTIELKYKFENDPRSTDPVFNDPIFVADLLDWVQRFASEEAPHLVRESGKAGVGAFVSTMDRLRKLVRASLVKPREGAGVNPGDVPAGYRTDRVQRALQELAHHLEEALDLSCDIATEECSKLGRRKKNTRSCLTALRH